MNELLKLIDKLLAKVGGAPGAFFALLLFVAIAKLCSHMRSADALDLIKSVLEGILD